MEKTQLEKREAAAAAHHTHMHTTHKTLRHFVATVTDFSGAFWSQQYMIHVESRNDILILVTILFLSPKRGEENAKLIPIYRIFFFNHFFSLSS